MSSAGTLTLLTDRDRAVLRALSFTPLTAEQLLTWSQTFPEPFKADRYLRHRLQILSASGWVACRQYATIGRGALNYYQLTPTGFRLLHGPDTPLPSRRLFLPVSLALQPHTQRLASFLVHVVVTAKGAGLHVAEIIPEGTLTLDTGDGKLQPDLGFQILTPEGEAYNFLVELDNGSEPVCSTRERESWSRKCRLYELYQDRCANRFRVLVVTAQQGERTHHILREAARHARNRDRRLVYGVSLERFFSESDALRSPCFLDHHLQSVPMLPSSVPAAAEIRPRREVFEVATAV